MQLSYSTYYDKVLGGWIGKCAGGILGAPIEGIKAFNDIELSEKLFLTNFPNDDLDLQLLWLDMVKKKGPYVRESDFAEHWVNHVGFPWNEYGIATRNIRLGLYPPQSGMHNNYYWNASMGCPIRSEIWGMLCAGNPSKSMFYAGMDGSLDHYGFSVEAEQFLSACAAIAFIENDIRKILDQALSFFNESSLIYRLVSSVIYWQKECNYSVAMGKIKSYWGDADFTSAPMNVGFTLLALLHSGDNFDCVLDALHMGHDSDCIAATVGALVGIIKGYSAIPDNWKKMVGNELLVSRELKNIVVPQTITGLAEQTCRAGISFINLSNDLSLTGELPEAYEHTPGIFHLSTSVSQNQLKLGYENLSSKGQRVSLRFRSSRLYFAQDSLDFEVNAGVCYHTAVSLNVPVFEEAAALYYIDVSINNEEKGSLERGILSQGSWLMIGPFIEEDVSLLPLHPEFPEHGGMSSMPSVSYMNHDRHNYSKDFLSQEDIKILLKQDNWNDVPYMVQKIRPQDFRINLQEYYYGKGERSVYLCTYLTLEESKRLWISMGCSAPFKMWVNGSLIYTRDNTSRCWIGNSILPFDFQAGKNLISLKLDLITDINQLEIGFKEFTGKHPHQEQWSLLVPGIASSAG